MNCKLLQLINKSFIDSAFVVLKLDKSKEISPVQLLNKLSIYITFEVSKLDKSKHVKLLH